MIIPFWAFAGTFYLIILTIQDYRHKNIVDDRFNFFMFGVTSMILSHYPTHLNIWYILLIVGIGLGLRYYVNKFKLTGEADANTFAWIFTGYGFMDFHVLTVALIIFIGMLLLVIILKWVIFKNKQPQAFYGVILIYFVATNLLLGVYK